MKTLMVTKYILPLREGGSLPAIVEADDGQQYVMKFIGAGQGSKALIADLLAGEMARHLGFKIPELVFLDFDPVIGRKEPDPEIQDLLLASPGLNLGMKFLEQSSSFSLLLSAPKPSTDFASRLVWFDSFITNVDRTAKNVNMLVHKGEIWLIDHGAGINFHHNWQDHIKQSETPFSYVKEHVLLSLAHDLNKADAYLRPLLTTDLIKQIVHLIPEQWLQAARFNDYDYYRNGYIEYFSNRLEKADIFIREAENAKAKLV